MSAYLTSLVFQNQKSDSIDSSEKVQLFENVIIGDVGGTNVRLELKKVYREIIEKIKNETLKPAKAYKSQEYDSFQDCILDYLKDVPAQNAPKFGVVGIAGPVNQNTVITVNNPHWPVSDGYAIGEICKMDNFTFINDFTAAGNGVATLTHKDY